jgi:surface antigen
LDGTIGSIAGTLGLSTQQFQSQLASGTSLANIAQQQGVSRSSLVSSIEQAVQQNRQSAGLPPIDQTQLDRAVNRAVDRQHHGHRRSQATSSAQPVQQTPQTTQLGVLGSTFDQLA